nr:PrsW family intramembrane metalloprotease [Anaerolineae bacterium]
MEKENDLSIRRSVWISSLITLAGLALFVIVAALIPPPENRLGLIFLGIFITLVPAVIWMVFFYQQDRSEPEPKRLIIRIFVFGALAAAAVAVPLGELFADVTLNQFAGWLPRLLLTILSVSLIQEVLKVAMVRYVVLGTNEFDRHPDGIVYGMASGIGFATVLSLYFVLNSGGVRPLAGAIQAANNVLIHGVLGAISGYYIGRVKIDGKRLGWMVRGLAIVVVLNGIYQVVRSELASRLTFNPWYSLLAAVLLAVISGAVLFAVFKRALARARGDLTTISLAAHARSMDMPWDIKVKYDWLLIGGLLLACIVGLGVGSIANAATTLYDGDSVSAQFRYPSNWAVQGGETGIFSVEDLAQTGAYKPVIIVHDEKVEDANLEFLVAQRVTSSEGANAFFNELVREAGLVVDGADAIRSEYEYVTDTGAGPVVVRGVTTYVISSTRFYTFTFEADPDLYDEMIAHYERLLRSVKLQGAE